MYTEPDYTYPPTSNDSVGYGLLGCAGGILMGLLGGGLLLTIISLLWAILTPIPAAATSDLSPDLRLTIAEDSLNHLARNQSGEPIQLDLLPGNQVNLKTDTTVSAFGVSVPVQMTGRFGVQITAQSAIEVRLIEANVSGIELPPETINDLFSSPLAAINQNLNQTVENGAAVLGVPLILTGLGTTETELWLEARTTP